MNFLIPVYAKNSWRHGRGGRHLRNGGWPRVGRLWSGLRQTGQGFWDGQPPAGFNRTPAVIDGCSDLLVEVFGDAGRGARSAVGMADLPFDIPVEIEAVVQVSSPQFAPSPLRLSHPVAGISGSAVSWRPPHLNA